MRTARYYCGKCCFDRRDLVVRIEWLVAVGVDIDVAGGFLLFSISIQSLLSNVSTVSSLPHMHTRALAAASLRESL